MKFDLHYKTTIVLPYFIELKTPLDIRYILISELLKQGWGMSNLRKYVIIIPILQMRDKEIKYLSQYLTPINLVSESVLLTNIPYHWWDDTWPRGIERKIQAL